MAHLEENVGNQFIIVLLATLAAINLIRHTLLRCDDYGLIAGLGEGSTFELKLSLRFKIQGKD